MKKHLTSTKLFLDQVFNWNMVRSKDGTFGHICISSLEGKRYVCEIVRQENNYIALVFVSDSSNHLNPRACNFVKRFESDRLECAKNFCESLIKSYHEQS